MKSTRYLVIAVLIILVIAITGCARFGGEQAQVDSTEAPSVQQPVQEQRPAPSQPGANVAQAAGSGEVIPHHTYPEQDPLVCDPLDCEGKYVVRGTQIPAGSVVWDRDRAGTIYMNGGTAVRDGNRFTWRHPSGAVPTADRILREVEEEMPALLALFDPRGGTYWTRANGRAQANPTAEPTVSQLRLECVDCAGSPVEVGELVPAGTLVWYSDHEAHVYPQGGRVVRSGSKFVYSLSGEGSATQIRDLIVKEFEANQALERIYLPDGTLVWERS